jgi:hypothetical protein
MYLLSNKESRDRYRMQERMYLYAYVTILTAICAILVLGIVDTYLNWKFIELTTFISIWWLKTIFLYMLLLTTCCLLLIQMKYKYNHEYKIQKNAIIVFTCTELLSNTIAIIQNYYFLFGHKGTI